MNSTIIKQISDILENKYIVLDISNKNNDEHFKNINKTFENNKVILFTNKIELVNSLISLISSKYSSKNYVGYIIYKGRSLIIPKNEHASNVSIKKHVIAFINGNDIKECVVCYEKNNEKIMCPCKQCASYVCTECMMNILNNNAEKVGLNDPVDFHCPICSYKIKTFN